MPRVSASYPRLSTDCCYLPQIAARKRNYLAGQVLADDQLARRIRAAIDLGGFTGVPALASELGAGWGQDTLYEVLAGKREIPEYVLREIARVCDVPFEFFTEPFENMTTPADHPGSAIDQHDQTVRDLHEQATAQRREHHDEVMGCLRELLGYWRANEERIVGMQQVLIAMVAADVEADADLRALAQEIGTSLPGDQEADRRQNREEGEQHPPS